VGDAGAVDGKALVARRQVSGIAEERLVVVSVEEVDQVAVVVLVARREDTRAKGWVSPAERWR
jgi:hypothetical protein